MSQIRNQATSNSIISYLGIVLGYLNVAIIFPQLLSKEVFGLTQIIISASVVISTIGSLGTQLSVLKFYPIFKNRKLDLGVFFSLLHLVGLAGISLIFFIMFLFDDYIIDFYSKQAPLFSEYYYLLFPLVLIGVYGLIIDSYSMAINKSSITAFNKEIVVRLIQLATVILYYFQVLTAFQFIIAFNASQIIYLLLMYYQVFQNTPFTISFAFKSIPKSIYVEFRKYTGVSLLSSTQILANNGDVLLVGSMLGLEATALYSVASAIGRIIIVPMRALNRVTTSSISEAWEHNNLGRIDRIYKKSAMTGLILGSTLLIGVTLNFEILKTLIPSNYQNIEQIVFFIALAKLVQMSTGVNAAIIATSSKYQVNMFVNLSTLVLLILFSILLINQYGINGAAYASILVYIISNFFKAIYLKQVFGFNFITKPFLIVLLLVVFVLIIGIYIPQTEFILINFAIRSIYVLVAFNFLIYKMNFSEEYTELVNSFLKKIFYR